MPAVQRQYNLLHEIARAVHSVGYALRKLLATEPVPYWADYLREEREKQH